MKKIISVFFAGIICSLFISCKTHSQCADESNVYHFTYDGHKYEIIKELKSWADAVACAVERGGYLVEINDSAEQSAVYNAIISSGIQLNYKPVDDGGGTSYLWIGGTDKATEGVWIWDGDNDNKGTNFWNGQGTAGKNDGSIISNSYVNCGGKSSGTLNEPDDYASDQDALALALTAWPYGTSTLGAPGEWNDINSNNRMYFIVEFPGQEH